MLALSAFAATFLEAALTVQIVYTFELPYLLMLLALAAGLPSAVRGWLLLPRLVRWAAGALVLANLLALAFGTNTVLPGSGRGGPLRGPVYVSDAIVGLAALCLLRCLASQAKGFRAATTAFVAGALVASLYAVYQWPARHFGLPLASINNVLDSNGVTTAAAQGSGILGWERIRGTFLEPHFLAGYLAAVIPIALGLLSVRHGRTRLLAGVVVATGGVALLLTASAPAWAILCFALLATAAAMAVALGQVRLATALGVAFATAVLLAPLAATEPQFLAGLTGRSGADLVLTSSFRTDAWSAAGDVWSRRPVLGYGPGQSSVQMALERPSAAGPILLSAQGLWASSLIDAGIVGFGLWCLFIGGVLTVGFRSVLSTPTWLGAGLLAAAVATVISSELAGDRLDLRAWLLFGLVLAAPAASSRTESDAAQRRDEPEYTTA